MRNTTMTGRLCGVLLAACAALLIGCGDKAEEHEDHTGHEGHDAGGHAEPAGAPEAGPSAADIDAALDELGTADAALARAQKTCPVSGEPLGVMGKPFKAEAGGRTVFLCCKGCYKKFVKDPDQYLAKLGGTSR